MNWEYFRGMRGGRDAQKESETERNTEKEQTKTDPYGQKLLAKMMNKVKSTVQTLCNAGV